MSLGDIITFAGGSYDIRGMIDGRYVVRIRIRNTEAYKVWIKAEREDFDRGAADSCGQHRQKLSNLRTAHFWRDIREFGSGHRIERKPGKRNFRNASAKREYCIEIDCFCTPKVIEALTRPSRIS